MCLDWSDPLVKERDTGNTPEERPEADLTSNYCRNPDHDSYGIWCYYKAWDGWSKTTNCLNPWTNQMEYNGNKCKVYHADYQYCDPGSISFTGCQMK